MRYPAFAQRSALLALVLLAVNCEPCKVVRVRNGNTFCEREIDPGAYAAYARGQLRELEGHPTAAIREYERVIDLDARAAQAWIRLGALKCRTDPAAAEGAWHAAHELAADSYSLWYERARCAFDRGELRAADSFARRALALGPSDPEVTLLGARIASRMGDTERETALLFGALAVQPSNATLWIALASSPTAPAVHRNHAVRRLLGLRPIDESWVPPTYLKTKRADPLKRLTVRHLREQLDLALARRNAPEATRIAALLGVSSQQLALAALDAGFYSLASDQAGVLLALDPDDTSAWLIAVLAADLSPSETRFRELLSHPPKVSAALDNAFSAALLELVRRVAGP
jgi:tetratricopeptide (TPR) repeat protein